MKTSSSIINLIEKTIKYKGGFIKSINDSGRRSLPYEFIGKGVGERFTQANIVTVEFAGKPKENKDLNKMLVNIPEVIRVNILKDERLLFKPTAASVVAEEL